MTAQCSGSASGCAASSTLPPASQRGLPLTDILDMREVLEGLSSLVAPLRCAGCDEAKESRAAFCDGCAALLEPVVEPGAVFEYGGPVGDAIRRLKYEGRSELGPVLGSLMADHVGRWAGEVEAVVPVPLHWRRRRARGDDQAALLTKQRNVAGAFAPWRLHGATRVLLVDDVRTTGATLRAAAEALRAGGVSEVRTFVLAARVLAKPS